MAEYYLPLDRSPLVNIRRAIKRSSTKRQANFIIESGVPRKALKEYFSKK